jgi:ArsR family transcriptional regulator
MSSGSPKRQVFEQLAFVAKALAHADRLDLIEHLGQGERSVEALARLIGQPVANASQHLQQLRRAGLVTARRDGKYVLYRLADDDVIELITALSLVTERGNAEVDRILRGYFSERDSLEPVSREELMERYRQGLITVLDVRPAEEFAAGHLPGAVNVPLNELEARIEELDPSQQVVAYCRGAYCVFSFEAVSRLRDRGFDARRLVDGLPEWRAAGFPVEHEDARPR